MADSKLLYFVETTPLKEQIFNSYMDETVMLHNEEWTAQVQHEMNGALNPIFLALHLQQKWLEMVRDN